MKCPKCHYISFESSDRCRNCGYDFALLASEPDTVDAPLRDTSAADGPLPELALRHERGWPAEERDARGSAGGVDLPLFNEPVPGLDDTPLISAPSPPRPPLSVRRATPEPSRLPRPGRHSPQRRTPHARPTPVPQPSARPAPARPTPGPADPVPWLIDDAVEPATVVEAPAAAPVHDRRPEPREVARADETVAGDAASPVARLGALAVDIALLAAINLSVVHFTLAVVGYPWSRLGALPVLPLVAFCLMLDAGYFILLTGASGQTLGKMLAGVRVIGIATPRVAMPQAALRAALATLSAVTLGLGYLPALVGRDRRALHDRLANTRVVGV